MRHIIPHFNRGTEEVHVIFDNPGRLKNTPKFFEHQRRDATVKLSATHCCDELKSSTLIAPGKWRENIINCRECKRRLVVFLGIYFLSNISPHLRSNQKLYIAGAFENELADTAWYIQHGSKNLQPDPTFNSNAEETDTRIWLHARKTPHNKILVISPDTDVYHIGLPLQCAIQKQVIVQVSPVNSKDLKLIHLTQLIKALQDDPDLAGINPSILPQILQTLYRIVWFLSATDF